MAPIKFEEDIRETLEKRAIEPTTKSWNTLATRLEVKEEKKGINFRVWFSAAASIIGVLFAYTLLFNTNSNIPLENVVDIKSQVEENDLTKEKVNNTENFLVETKVGNSILEEEESNVEKLNKTQIKTEAFQSKKEYLAATQSKKKEEEKKQEKKSLNGDAIKNQTKNNKVYYALNAIENKSKNKLKKTIKTQGDLTSNTLQVEVMSITDNELDALLKNAKSEIAKSENESAPLDYNELLQDVEDDLEESFRDKLLKTVKGSYRSVKSYVAERND